MARDLVLDGQAEDIIGYSTATALRLVQIEHENDPVSIKTVTINKNTTVNPQEEYPEIFTGNIGNLKDFRVTLDVDPTIRPIQQPSYPVEFALYDLA